MNYEAIRYTLLSPLRLFSAHHRYNRAVATRLVPALSRTPYPRTLRQTLREVPTLKVSTARLIHPQQNSDNTHWFETLQVPDAQVVGPFQPCPPHCPYSAAEPPAALVVAGLEVVVVVVVVTGLGVVVTADVVVGLTEVTRVVVVGAGPEPPPLPPKVCTGGPGITYVLAALL